MGVDVWVVVVEAVVVVKPVVVVVKPVVSQHAVLHDGMGQTGGVDESWVSLSLKNLTVFIMCSLTNE